ncbi:MAG TPA: VOC family protein [Steroidobacteraceae bacterium]|jgi:catechol 2,3-dioxygenase-like lactoylglutathione lyase family enzyme
MENEEIVIDLLSQFERGKISRRNLIQGLVTGIAAASAVASVPAFAAAPAHKGFKAVAVNHISYGVADYGRTRDFYAELLGMRVSEDNGKQCALSFGDSFLIPRHTRQPDNKPFVDHIAYTIDNWNKDEVEAELRSRGFEPRKDTEDSFHIKDPDGFDLQISGKNMKAAP